MSVLKYWDTASSSWKPVGLVAADTFPMGAVIPWVAPGTPPSGWLLCDGSPIPEQYAALIAAIGPNTPDMVGRFPRGAGAYNGNGGGADTVSLTAAQMPPFINLTATTAASGGTGENNGTSVAQGAASGRFSHRVDTQGAGQPVSIIPRYLDFRYIIKASQPGGAATGVVDTGWVDATVSAGFAPMAGAERPQVRRVGSQVYMRGGFLNTGITVNGTFSVGTIPAEFIPPLNVITQAGTSVGTAGASLFVTSGGVVQLRTNATISAYYTCNTSWLVD